MDFGQLRDALVAADPGLTRLYSALRATASVATALAILLAVAHAYSLPLSVPLLGAAICITWSVTVQDSSPRDQRITTLIMWFPAALCVAVGTLCARVRYLDDVLFLGVLFAAVYIRRYGARYNALGMISVLPFFFTLFLRAGVQTLPWLMLAVTVSAACTYVYRFFIFRDRPQLALANAFEAFRARQRLIAATIAQAARAGSWSKALKARIERHLYRLNENAITIGDLIGSERDDEIRARVLDTELETGAVVDRALKNPRTAPPLPQLAAEPGAHAQRDWTPRGAYRVGTQVQTRFLQPSTRQAIQITVAAAASMIAGELLSPQRWYWAVLTAFLVFSGASSTGETLIKGWSRVAGTALGIAAGAAVALVVHGRDAPALALMFLFLFIAVYMIRVSYAVFTFFLTALLSMLYVLIGQFTDQLLVIRLIETIVGATCGGLAALVLLPIRTREVLGSVSIEALERLDAVIKSSVARLEGDPQADPLAAARSYDEALQSLRAQIVPLLATLRFSGRDPLRTRLALFGALGRYARELAISAHDRQPQSVDRLADAGSRVDLHIRALIDGMKAGTVNPSPGAEKPPADGALSHLYEIDRAVHRLGQLLRPAGPSRDGTV